MEEQQSGVIFSFSASIILDIASLHFNLQISDKLGAALTSAARLVHSCILYSRTQWWLMDAPSTRGSEKWRLSYADGAKNCSCDSLGISFGTAWYLEPAPGSWPSLDRCGRPSCQGRSGSWGWSWLVLALLWEPASVSYIESSVTVLDSWCFSYI